MKADDLALAVRIDRHSDYRCDRNDTAALALLQIGRVQPAIGPLARQGTIKKGADALVDVLAELRHRALANPRKSHRLHQIVDAPGRNAPDPGFLDDRHQSLLRKLPRLEKRREVAALPKLRNAKLQRAEPRVERAVPVAVAISRPLRRSFVTPGADHALHVGLHQKLHHRLRNCPQKITVSGFGQKLDQR